VPLECNLVVAGRHEPVKGIRDVTEPRPRVKQVPVNEGDRLMISPDSAAVDAGCACMTISRRGDEDEPAGVAGTPARLMSSLGHCRAGALAVVDITFGISLVLQTLAWWVFWGRRGVRCLQT
jgi:hypothetical protein